MSDSIPVVDVFAGCGGFGEGFNALRQGSRFPFDVRLNIEKDPAPIRTLQLRAFYHRFRETGVPDSYYEYGAGKIHRDKLFAGHPQEAAEAMRRCLGTELGGSDAGSDHTDEKIRRATGDADRWVLIGGPPCQAYSVIGRSRNRSLPGYDPDQDIRMVLYREYLKIVAAHWPAVFVMENVRGLLSASHRKQPIFQRMIDELREPAQAFASRSTVSTRNHQYRLYPLTTTKMDPAPHDYIVKTDHYGIPQARHRVIIMGVRDDIVTKPEPLLPTAERVAAKMVLDGLPAVRSGLSRQDNRERWRDAVNRIQEQEWWNETVPAVQERIRKALDSINATYESRGAPRFLDREATSEYRPDWFEDERLTGTLNHYGRGHREDDLWRYLFAACAMADGKDTRFRIGDFPAGLRPDHRSVEAALSKGSFADRFGVVPRNAPSKTVVSHIRKDGHQYIHYDPAQCRSLTVREAARLQTFPDNYIFEGSRTEQYGQVGNAVPPLLAYQIAERVADMLEQN